MAGSALGPMVSTLFTPAAAAGTAAAGTAAFAGLGTQIVGGAIAGWGMGKMKEAEMDKEEQMIIDAEKRQQATYDGAGEAVRFWNAPQSQNNTQHGTEYARASDVTKVGQGFGRPGEQFRRPAPEKPAKYKFDRNTGQIVSA